MRLWWGLSSPAFEFVEGVGAVGLSAHCCMGGLRLSLEHIRRAVISDEALYYYFLLSYAIVVGSVLAGI